ncbi:hypothetical protein LJR030_005386 [Rhizobium sp. LjRoot30]|uniref:hypothetical protein n=1 Tax=Rhizobium sp. LjRoot30 TaxID=3342320 RepID=UPI003ECC6ADC
MQAKDSDDSDALMERFASFTIDDLVLHDKVLDDYPFLSAQILNRWLRDGRIRYFKGREGKTVYPKQDLSLALRREMERSRNDSFAGDERGSVRPASAPTDVDARVRTEADELREELSMRSIFGPRKCIKSLRRKT